MARVTIKSINRAILDAGLNAEIVRGVGYFYFVGDDVDLRKESSVYVYRLNELSIEEWVEEAREKCTSSYQ